MCKKNTVLVPLKFLDQTELTEEDVKILEKTGDMPTPKMTRVFYLAMKSELGNNIPSTNIMNTISRIKPHNKGLFKDQCNASNKVFLVFVYLLMNHEKQEAGSTFRISREIKE